MTAKRALITGVTGQDGAYLSQLLLEKGYDVYGIARRSASADVFGDGCAGSGVSTRSNSSTATCRTSPLDAYRPRAAADEVYNLAAQSFVESSWDQPMLTGHVTGVGALNMLEAVRLGGPRSASTRRRRPRCSAWSRTAQNETTPFYPRSPMAWPSSTPTG